LGGLTRGARDGIGDTDQSAGKSRICREARINKPSKIDTNDERQVLGRGETSAPGLEIVLTQLYIAL